MEEVKGTNIPAAVVPFTSEDKYPTHSEEYGRGGYRSVDTKSQMNAIPVERRKEGMLVNVKNDKIYTLKNGNFVDAGLGGSSVGATPNLSIEIKTEIKDNGTYGLFFKFKEKHENGYIQFLKKKKQRYNTSGNGTVIIAKYAVNDFYYTHMSGISVSNLSPDTWYEYSYIKASNLIKKYAKGSIAENSTSTKFNTVRFTGNTHASPIKYPSLNNAALPNKKTSVMHMALQYNIVNPNYKNGIRENGNLPKPFLERGNMEKFTGRIRARAWSTNPELYLSVK